MSNAVRMDMRASQPRSDQFNFRSHTLQLEQFNISLGQFFITGAFIDEYNRAGHGIEKSKLDYFLFNLLTSLKKIISTDEKVKAPDVKRNSFVWSNLCGLLLCRGNLRIAALETLIHSLHTSEIHPSHVGVLLYAASTLLYIIQSDVLLDTKLSRFEVGLFYLGYLICKRLLVHYHLGEVNQNEADIRLSVYLKNFHSSQDLYKNLSVLEWYHGYITGACYYIIKSNRENRHHPLLKMPSRPRESLSNRFYGRVAEDHGLSSWSLWQALYIWQSTRNESKVSFENYVELLHTSSKNMRLDNWIDCSLAIDIIGETAKDNLQVLLILQLLARGSEEIIGLLSWSQKVIMNFIQTLIEICRDAKKSIIRKQALLGNRPITVHPFDSDGSRYFGKHKPSSRCTSLVDLALFRFSKNASDDKEELAWKIRHAAYLGLMQLLKGIGDGSSSYDYMKTMCWAVILKIKHNEDDERVLVVPGISEISMFQPENLGIYDESDGKYGVLFNDRMANALVSKHLMRASEVSTARTFKLSLNVGREISSRQKVNSNTSKSKEKPHLKCKEDLCESTSPTNNREVGLAETFYRNEILMYTSVKDVTSRIIVQVADYIMRDVNEKWNKEIRIEKIPEE